MDQDLNLLTFDADAFAFDSMGYRGTHKLSRHQLAVRIGTTPHVVNSFESRLTRPSVEVFMNLCKLMGKEANSYFKKNQLTKSANII